MPLNYTLSALTTRPQRLTLCHKITYTSDSSVSATAAIYTQGATNSRSIYSTISREGNTSYTAEIEILLNLRSNARKNKIKIKTVEVIDIDAQNMVCYS